MGRSCVTLSNYFRILDRAGDFRRRQAVLESYTREALRRGRGVAPRFPTRIPVVVHVLYNTDAQNVSDDQIRSQIDVLNEDFRNANGDLDTVPGAFQPLIGNPDLTFELAPVDPDGNPTSGITRTATDVVEFGTDDSMKAAATGGVDPWDATRYLNMWICVLSGGILGYAQFPGGPPETDGVVILTSAFGRGGSAQAPFNQGRTAVHEVGHYLNLSHIWGESRFPTCTDSDYVNDTPNQYEPNYGTPTFPSVSCENGPDGDMFMNFMDYVDDAAMVMFSQDQVLRMHAALESERAQLGTLADGSPMFS